MPDSVREAVEAIRPWLVETRRTIHMNPEIAYEEYETSRFVADYLDGLGVEVKRGIAKTGVVGLLQTGRQGPTIGIRAEMDALPIQEENEVPYKSRNAGMMHACGHDVHTTMLLGVARTLTENPHLLEGVGGNVKFIFQPAEEGKAGGRKMVEQGVLKDPNVDLVIAAHVFPTIPVSYVGTRSGPARAATDKFEITLKGTGGHGAYPQFTRDPILIAAHLITALQAIVSRNVDPFDSVVISVTQVNAGATHNIIPNEARLVGTLRTVRQETREKVVERMEETIQGIASAFGGEGDFNFIPGYPALINHAGAISLIETSAKSVLGEEKVVVEPPNLGGDDFAYIALERPAAMFRLGVGNEEKGITHGLHTAKFDIDEDALQVGVSVLVQAVREFLAHSNSYLT